MLATGSPLDLALEATIHPEWTLKASTAHWGISSSFCPLSSTDRSRARAVYRCWRSGRQVPVTGAQRWNRAVSEAGFYFSPTLGLPIPLDCVPVEFMRAETEAIVAYLRERFPAEPDVNAENASIHTLPASKPNVCPKDAGV